MSRDIAVSGGCTSWQRTESSQATSGYIARYGEPHFAGDPEAGDGHDVVVVEDRGGAVGRAEEPSRCPGAVFAGVVGGNDAGRGYAEALAHFGERFGAYGSVQEFGYPADASDVAVAEGGEVSDGLFHGGCVVGPYADETSGSGPGTDDDGREFQFLKDWDTGVVDAEVTDEDAVDAPLPHQRR